MSELKAGRELDKAIAEKVFGYTVKNENGYGIYEPGFVGSEPITYVRPVPAYSTDANACALVKTKMMELGYEITINYYPGKPRWRTSLFSPHKDLLDSWADGGTEVESFCLAALKATEGK